MISLSTRLLLVLCVAGLSGCSNTMMFPDPGSPLPAAVPMGSFHGSVYGGHAPIVNSRVFVLQAGTSGYGGKAVSLLDAPYAATPQPYATAKDSTGDATNGMSYVTTNAAGYFNVTGDYSCTPGLPVYLYAAGGTSTLSAGNGLTQYTVSGNSITFTSYNLVSVGQYVSFYGMPAALSGLNSGTYPVTAAVPENDLTNTPNNFTVTVPAGYAGSGTLVPGNSIAYVVGNNNPAIVNLALLGVCPTTGAPNFSSLNYVYVNEVSTVATAYGLSGFFSNSATQLNSTDAVHLSIPQENGNLATSPAWVGIQDAAATVADIYNIQGTGTISNTGNGEGHIANITTPNGGTVSQSLVDAIANSLAACVDSGNTYDPILVTGTASPACSTLFTRARSTATIGGITSGTPPVDIATAAINIAHNPWNVNAPTILGLATGTQPFAPAAATSNDLAVTITYPMTGVQSGIEGGVAIDSANNVWATSFNTTALTKLSNTGAQLFQYTSFPFGPGMVAFDSKDNAWVSLRGAGLLGYTGTASGVYEFTSAGAVVAGSPFLQGNDPIGSLNQNYGPFNTIWVAVDAQDHPYFAQHPYNNILELNTNGSVLTSWEQGQDLPSNNTAWSGPVTNALDYTGNVYATVLPTATGNTSHAVEKWTGSTTVPSTLLQTIKDPFGIALDAAGNAWITDLATTSLFELPSGGTAVNTYASTGTAGGVNAAVGVAVDPAGLVYVSSPGTAGVSLGAISVFGSATKVFLTGGSGLNGSINNQGTTPMANPYFIAVDESGNLWVNTDTTLVKFVGLATPVLTPMSANLVKGQVTHQNLQRP